MQIRQPNPLRSALFCLALMTGWAGAVHAADWFVAPTGAQVSADPTGTESDPFPDVGAAFASGKVVGGDRILLQDGSHGALNLSGLSFATQVIIMAQNERVAHVESVMLRNGTRNLRISGLTVMPSDPSKAAGYLVDTDRTTSEIVIDRLSVSSGPDAEDFMNWDAAKWDSRRFSGIRVNGSRSIVVRNRVIALYMGIEVGGSFVRVGSNFINGFNGDGLRGLGDNNVFRGNRVFNCVATDGNHDDGFQSFVHTSSVIRNLTIDRNMILEWTGDPSHPLRCDLQGIGLFDGFYEDLTITNNLVAVSQFHGISVYGANRVRIVNNTVVNSMGPYTAPFIMVTSHKDGRRSRDVVLANNIAMSLHVDPKPEGSLDMRNNSVIGNPVAVFRDPFAFDFTLRPNSGFIDTADETLAPSLDVFRRLRTGNGPPDRGAIEATGTLSLTGPAGALLSEGWAGSNFKASSTLSVGAP